MSSFRKTPFIKLEDITSTFNSSIPKPSTYGRSTDGIIIISTNSQEYQSVPGIYQFDINTTSMSLVHKYDTHLVIGFYHKQFIVNDNLYLYGSTSEGVSYSFNFKTKKMERNNCKLYISMISYPIYIPAPINQIHGTNSDQHFICKVDDKNNVSLSYCEMLTDLDVFFRKSIFIPFKQQLMMFGPKNIFYYNIDQNINKNGIWKSYQLKLPYSEFNDLLYDILLSFNTLLFVFYFVKREIWCLDLKNNISSKSKYNIPDCIVLENDHESNLKILPIKDKNNNIHIVDFTHGFHYKVLSYDLIPDKIEKYNSKQYNPLIIGYIKQLENDKTIPTIPFVLKYLIWRYFPSFI